MDYHSEPLALRLIKLFREYADKLRSELSDLRAVRDAARTRKDQFIGTPEWDRLDTQFRPLESALVSATHDASTVAEQGSVSEASRIELRVRLAEVDGLLNAYKMLFNAPQLKVGRSRTAKPHSEPFALRLIKLFKEYAEKLRLELGDLRAARDAARTRKEQFFGSPDWERLGAQLHLIEPALITATREASNVAEQGSVSDASRIELRVRLAEVEGLLNAYNSVLNASH